MEAWWWDGGRGGVWVVCLLNSQTKLCCVVQIKQEVLRPKEGTTGFIHSTHSIPYTVFRTQYSLHSIPYTV